MGFYLQPHVAAAKRHPGSDLPLPAGVGVGRRFYNPSIGRWVSRDPIGERGGRNLAAFVANRTPNYVDTDGRFVYPIIIRPPPFPLPPNRGTASECAELRKFIDEQRQIRDAYQKSIGTCAEPDFPFRTGKLADPGMAGCFRIPNRFIRSICLAHESCHWRHAVSLPVKVFCARKDKCEMLDILAREEVPCYDTGIGRGEDLYRQYCSDPEPDGT